MSKTVKVTSFDPNTVKFIATIVEKTLNKELAKFGITVVRHGGKYFEYEYIPKFKMTINSPVASKKRSNEKKLTWNRYCAMFRLTPEMFGTKFKVARTTYTITGLNPRRPKNPIELLADNGKKFKSGPDYVLVNTMFGKKLK
jgi:hypothetical protein